MLAIFWQNLYKLKTDILVQHLDGEFEFIGFPVGVVSDESVGNAFHFLGQPRSELACLVLFFFHLSPTHGILALVAVVIGHVYDLRSLELKAMPVRGKLPAVGGECDRFFGGFVAYFVNTCLTGFDGVAQLAQF